MSFSRSSRHLNRVETSRRIRIPFDELIIIFPYYRFKLRGRHFPSGRLYVCGRDETERVSAGIHRTRGRSQRGGIKANRYPSGVPECPFEEKQVPFRLLPLTATSVYTTFALTPKKNRLLAGIRSSVMRRDEYETKGEKGTGSFPLFYSRPGTRSQNLANIRYRDFNLNSNWIRGMELVDPSCAKRNADFFPPLLTGNEMRE